MEALMEEDIECLHAHRMARALVQFKTHKDLVFTPDHGHLKVPLGLGMGARLPDVLLLKSCFYNW